ncbi:MAG: polysaccharide deacetylase family protein [Gemmatimonadales bacterium]
MLMSLVKAVAAGMLHHTGYLHRTERPALTVLGYHRVLTAPIESVTTCPLGMVATAAMFERQVEYLARVYKVVTLEQIQEACEGGRPLPERAGYITFDDGWADNYTVAYPILRRLGVPATIFVTTDYIGTEREFWFTTLMRALLEGRRPLQARDGREAGWPADVAGELDRLGGLPHPLRPWHTDQLIELLKHYPEARIDALVAALARRLDGATARGCASLFLTWDQLREMERGGMSVASHTCTHKILTQLTDDDAAEELHRSRETLEKELGHPVVSFAFPNGDYEPRHMTIAREVGYRYFFISTKLRPGGPEGRVFVRPCVHDLVGRGPGGSFSPSLMELHLSGVWERFRRLTK